MRTWASVFGWTSLAVVPLVALAAGCGGPPDAPAANGNHAPASATANGNDTTPTPEVEQPVVAVPDPAPPSDRALDQAATDTLRKLLYSMVERDQKTIEAICLPHPELAMLWFGEKRDAEELALLKNEIDTIAFSKLLPGDTMIDLSGKPIEIKPGDVKENQLLVTFPSNPITFFLEKQEGVWKVHPTPIIASRKASIAADQAAESEAQNGPSAQPAVQQPGIQTADQLNSANPPTQLKR